MRPWILSIAVVSLSLSCEKAKEAVPAATDAPKLAAEKVEDAGAKLSSGAVKTSEEVKETTATLKEGAESAAKETSAAVKEAIPDVNAMLDSGFSVDKLKGMLGSMNTDSLKGLADKLLTALQGKTDLLKSLKDQIAGLGVADIAKGADLKKQLDGLGPTISSLKEKLGVVVEKLKSSGIDVSKYTSFLTGQ